MHALLTYLSFSKVTVGSFKKLLVPGILLIALHVSAQPGNPNFSLSANTFFEVDMRSIALLAIETAGSSPDFSLSVPTPASAGEGLGSNPLDNNSDNWLNYSCATRDVVSRSISVYISSGSVPSGLEIELSVGNATGSGGGTLGTPSGSSVTLTSKEQTILSGIKGSYTGSGSGNGHQLSYKLNYAGSGNFSSLESANALITITYTLIDL